MFNVFNHPHPSKVPVGEINVHATSGQTHAAKKNTRIEKSNSNLHVNYNPMDGGCLMSSITHILQKYLLEK